MCLFPDPPTPQVAEVKKKPELDEASKRAREDQERKAKAAAGFGSTILTGSSGLAPATTSGSVLLGQ